MQTAMTRTELTRLNRGTLVLEGMLATHFYVKRDTAISPENRKRYREQCEALEALIQHVRRTVPKGGRRGKRH